MPYPSSGGFEYLAEERADFRRAIVIGEWICERLRDVEQQVVLSGHSGPSAPDAAFQTTSPAAAELLKALLLDINPEEYARAAEARKAALPAPGLEVSSSRSRARRGRILALAATLGTAYYLHFPEPPDPFAPLTANDSS